MWYTRIKQGISYLFIKKLSKLVLLLHVIFHLIYKAFCIWLVCNTKKVFKTLYKSNEIKFESLYICLK